MDCGHWSICSSHPSMKELGQIVCTHNKVQTGQSNPVLQPHEFYAARNFSSLKLVCDREKGGESGSFFATGILTNRFAQGLYTSVPKDGV